LPYVILVDAIDGFDHARFRNAAKSILDNWGSLLFYRRIPFTDEIARQTPTGKEDTYTTT
jgi:hypothetical protein